VKLNTRVASTKFHRKNKICDVLISEEMFFDFSFDQDITQRQRISQKRHETLYLLGRANVARCDLRRAHEMIAGFFILKKQFKRFSACLVRVHCTL